MKNSIVRHGWVVVFVLALGAASPAHAQLPNLNLRLHGGLAIPMGTFSDYFAAGPTAGLDLGYPLRDRFDLVLNLDLDYLNNSAAYIPDTRLWRYRGGIETALLGDPTDSFRVRVFGAAGATTFQSKTFYTDSRPAQAERFSNTYLTGTGGLRLGLSQGPLTWWLTGKINWSPVAAEDSEILRATPGAPVDPFESAPNVAITLGVGFPW